MTQSDPSVIQKLVAYLDSLDANHIRYRLEHIRSSIMIAVAVPGERWEIEFLPDGEIEVERFRSSGVTGEEGLLEELIAEHGSAGDLPQS